MSLHPPNPCDAQIGKIQEIYQSGPKKDDITLKVLWYYRPEEALGGRKVRGNRRSDVRVRGESSAYKRCLHLEYQVRLGRHISWAAQAALTAARWCAPAT